MLKLLSLLSFLGAGFLIWQRYVPTTLSFSRIPVPNASSSATLAPRFISLPEISVNLNVFPGEIKNNRWPVTSKGVIFLSTSPLSNTIIYGHNWPNILGPLKQAQVGQEISITYSDGLSKKFKISEIKIVGPNQTEILAPTADNRLTLYTCTGFLDSKRLVILARPVDSSTDRWP